MNEQGELYPGQRSLWDGITHYRLCHSTSGKEAAVVMVENAVTVIKAGHVVEQQRTIDDLQAKLELALAALPPAKEPEESRYATEMAEDDENHVHERLAVMEINRLRGALQYIAQWDTQTRPKNEYTELAMKAFAEAILKARTVSPVIPQPPVFATAADFQKRVEEMFKDQGNEVPHNGMPEGWRIDNDNFFTRPLGENEKVTGTLYEPALTSEVLEVFIDKGQVFARNAARAKQFDRTMKANVKT